MAKSKIGIVNNAKYITVDMTVKGKSLVTAYRKFAQAVAQAELDGELPERYQEFVAVDDVTETDILNLFSVKSSDINCDLDDNTDIGAGFYFKVAVSKELCLPQTALATVQEPQDVSPVTPSHATEKTFWGLVEEWLCCLETGGEGKKAKKAKTLMAYRDSLGVFKAWLEAEGIEAPTRQNIIDWRSSLNEKQSARNPGAKLSLATKNLYVTSVRVFFKWLSDTYGLPNLAAGIENLGQETKEHKRGVLTLDEMKKLMMVIETADLKGKRKQLTKIETQMLELKRARDRAIVGVLMASGLRTIELVRLRIGDVDDTSEPIYLTVLGKGRDDSETVKISFKAYQLIRDWLNARETVEPVRNDSPLFCSVAYSSFGDALTTHAVSNLCKFYLELANLKEKPNGNDKTKKRPITAHSLRGSLATNSYLNGAKLDEVKQQLRHRNLATTMRYIDDAEKSRNPCTDIISDAIF